jgi:hypothetical protein
MSTSRSDTKEVSFINNEDSKKYNTYILPTSGSLCVAQLGMLTKFLEIFDNKPTIAYGGSGGAIISHISDLNDWNANKIKDYIYKYNGSLDFFKTWTFCYVESCFKKSLYSHGNWCNEIALLLTNKGRMNIELVTAITKEKDTSTLIVSNRNKKESLISNISFNPGENAGLNHDKISFLDSDKEKDLTYLRKRIQFTLESTSAIPILTVPVKPSSKILDEAIENTTYVDAGISSLTPFGLLIDNLPMKLKSRVFLFSYENVDNNYQRTDFISQLIHTINTLESLSTKDEKRKIMENLANNRNVDSYIFTSEELFDNQNSNDKLTNLKNIFNSDKSFVAEFRLRVTATKLPYVNILKENIIESFENGYKHFDVMIYVQKTT